VLHGPVTVGGILPVRRYATPSLLGARSGLRWPGAVAEAEVGGPHPERPDGPTGNWSGRSHNWLAK
jgi:hypothetical protein